MAQFSDRQSVLDWINAHTRRRIRLSCRGSMLHVEGTTAGLVELDACATEIPYAELETDVPGLQVSITLHDEVLALHVTGGTPAGGRAPLALPLSIPYDRLRLAPADAPETDEAGAAREEPEFSPYELLHFPRSD